jgi:type I restriction enzyme M protein
LKDQVGANRRYPFGLPRSDNANYLWIQLFYSALNEKGRAGFVMANSASDARSSEQELRRQLIESRVVDVMVTVGPNFFYTVTLPCTLWFLDKGKKKRTMNQDAVLFVDARHIYRQIDRAHREWTETQTSFLANLVRLYRGETLDAILGGAEMLSKIEEVFPAGKYCDVPGLCKAATLKEIEAQGWSLNPGRYVGVAPGEAVSDEDFKEQLETLNEKLETLNAQARDLEQTIAGNVAEILEA